MVLEGVIWSHRSIIQQPIKEVSGRFSRKQSICWTINSSAHESAKLYREPFVNCVRRCSIRAMPQWIFLPGVRWAGSPPYLLSQNSKYRNYNTCIDVLSTMRKLNLGFRAMSSSIDFFDLSNTHLDRTQQPRLILVPNCLHEKWNLDWRGYFPWNAAQYCFYWKNESKKACLRENGVLQGGLMTLSLKTLWRRQFNCGQEARGAASVSILRHGMILMIHQHLYRWQSPILCQMGGQTG